MLLYRQHLILPVLGLTAGIAVSCADVTTVLTANHCANREGDDWCAEQHPDGSLPFCNWGSRECVDPPPPDGCVVEQPQDACYAKCGGATSIDDEPLTVLNDPSCEDVTGSTTDEVTGSDELGDTEDDTGTTDTSGTGETETGSSTTGPMPCVGLEDCMDASEPYCSNEGLCVACSEAPTAEEGDAACAAADVLTPACSDEGTCVACTSSNVTACEGITPLCDTDAETCIGCTQHEQCPDSACHIPSLIAGADDPDDGACFDVASVVHIDGDGARDFASLSAAVDAVDDDAEGVFIVHNWSGNYDEQVTVDGGKAIVFLAADGETPGWVQTIGGAGANPNLRIEDSATVFLHRMLINTNADPDGPGVEVSGARLHAQRSRIINNSGGGLGATGGAVVELEGCFVSGAPAVAPAVTANASDLAIRYSTLVRGFNAGNPVLTCTSPTSTTLVDSIVVNETPAGGMELSCPGASVVTSALETTNDASPWFDGVASGNFDLTPAGEAQFSNIAEWNTGDPPTDIDGSPRPTVDGTPDVAGAHLP